MDVEGPLVNAHVVVSTECESDDGLPHTLEHLVFLGSEKFPYKGVLDKVLDPLLSDTMYLLFRSRKSTHPQNFRINISISRI